MKKFTFALKSVAVLRSFKEAVARDRLAESIRSCAQIEERLAEMQLRLSEMERLRSGERNGRFRPADEISFSHLYRRECAEESSLKGQKAASQRELETRRQAFIEANRAVKAIGRLESKAIDAYRVDSNRIQQAEFDEFAGRRAARRTLIST
jgi:flagellar export protein FliJ